MHYSEYSSQVRWFGSNGKRYSKDFRTKKLAEQYARKLESKITAGNQDRPIRITLTDFSREHIKVMMNQMANTTLMDQKRPLRLFEKFIGGLVRLKEIQPRRAEAFLTDRLASGLAVETVNKDIRTLRRIFNLTIDPRGIWRDIPKRLPNTSA